VKVWRGFLARATVAHARRRIFQALAIFGGRIYFSHNRIPECRYLDALWRWIGTTCAGYSAASGIILVYIAKIRYFKIKLRPAKLAIKFTEDFRNATAKSKPADNRISTRQGFYT
jgi:hypothetical protein